MGKKDLLQSNYFGNKARFADVFNGTLFNGRQVIQPEDLEEADTELVHILESQETVKVICDKIQKWKGIYCSILVMENQSYVDYRMVLRVMKSEILGYEKQREDRYNEAVRKKVPFDKDEYLSQMKKNQAFVPIITLVLYLGLEKPWDGAKTLYQLLDMEPTLLPYVNDFKLNLYDFHDHQDFSMFRTENRILFEMLSCAQDKEKMKKTIKENPIWYENIDKNAAVAIAGIAGIKLDLTKYQDKDGGINMCKAFDDYKEEGRLEGRLEGKLEGRLEGRLEGIEEYSTVLQEINNALEKFWPISYELNKKINSQTDLAVLKQIEQLIKESSTLDELEKSIQILLNTNNKDASKS